jgi:hypothetical protein
MKYRARRKLADFGAEISTDEGVIPAKIIDVTHNGARLRMPRGAYARHVDVKILIRSVPYQAELVWQQNGDIGVKFDKPLTGGELDAVLRVLRKGDGGRKRRFLMS